MLIETFLRKYDRRTISDPVSVHTLLTLASNLNPSKSLELDPLKESLLSRLVVGILRKVDFKKDVESMLNLLTTIR